MDAEIRTVSALQAPESGSGPCRRGPKAFLIILIHTTESPQPEFRRRERAKRPLLKLPFYGQAHAVGVGGKQVVAALRSPDLCFFNCELPEFRVKVLPLVGFVVPNAHATSRVASRFVGVSAAGRPGCARSS